MAIILSDYEATKHKALLRHKRDPDRFLFNLRINGKGIRKTFKSNPTHAKADKLKTAYKAMEEFREMQTRVGFTGANPKATVDEFFDRLQKMTERNTETQKTYENHYKRYIKPTIGKMQIVKVSPRHISDITALTKHLANSTRQKSIAILMPIFRLAIDEEIIQFSPIKEIHKVKRKQLEEKKVINNAETLYRKVYAAINQAFGSDDLVTLEDGSTVQCSINPKIRALFLLGIHGRRKTEALRLKWDDVDFDNNTYQIRGNNSKINTDMLFSLAPDVKEALLQCERYGDYIFSSNRDATRPISEIREHVARVRALSVPEYNFHWMRNLVVSAYAAIGVEAIYLSSMLGHTDTNTVKQYLSLQREAASRVTNEASRKLLERVNHERS